MSYVPESVRKRQVTFLKNPKSNNQIASIELIMIEKEMREIEKRYEELMDMKDEILERADTETRSYFC